ncbi:MAG: universal stress protein [Planctomycetota bacterium]
MEAPRKIVVALDSEEPLVEVFDEACALGKTFGAELVLVHAIPDAPPMTPNYDLIAERIGEVFDDLALRAQTHGASVDPARYVRFGPPKTVIYEVIAETGANWLVLGAANKTTVDYLLLGSTAEAIIRSAPVPVWLVRPGRAHKEPKEILCAFDGSDAAREALEASLFLARNFVGRLTLVSAGEEPVARQVLEDVRHQVDMHGVHVDSLVRPGNPSDEILGAVAELHPDLLVLGCAGRKGLARLWHKNTAERLVRRAPCSILSLKAPALV